MKLFDESPRQNSTPVYDPYRFSAEDAVDTACSDLKHDEVEGCGYLTDSIPPGFETPSNVRLMKELKRLSCSYNPQIWNDVGRIESLKAWVNESFS